MSVAVESQRGHDIGAAHRMAGNHIDIAFDNDRHPRIDDRLLRQMQAVERARFIEESRLWTVEILGLILLANRKVEEMFGYSREDLLGHEVETLVPKSLRAGHRQLRTHRMASGYHTHARDMGVVDGITARRRDGSIFAVDISHGPLHRDGAVHTVVSVRDLTQKMAADAARIHLLERVCDLEAELESLKMEGGAYPGDDTVGRTSGAGQAGADGPTISLDGN